MTGPPKVDLTPVEDQLVQLLRACCQWLNKSQPQLPRDKGGPYIENGQELGKRIQYNGPVEARIAGGWVRDKLLRKESNDIDVSVSIMTGLEFANLFGQWLDAHHQHVVLEPSSSSAPLSPGLKAAMSGIHKISANPDQSKHLETAKVTIQDPKLELDFVNLRKEVYEGDSRIPTMTFGTPQEDAERRDICINALFYNVNTGQVEDWTGKALTDLKEGLIRTPLEPLTTFLDDPLRVLRTVRFATRYEYKVDEAIVECLTGRPRPGKQDKPHVIADPRLRGVPPERLLVEGRDQLRQALKDKVSGERVGTEVEKMMESARPIVAHRLLDQLGLYSLIFRPRQLQALDSQGRPLRLTSEQHSIKARRLSDQQPVEIDDLWSLESSKMALRLASIADELQSLEFAPLANKDSRRWINFAAAVYPVRDFEVEEVKGRDQKRKWLWAIENILMEGIKVGRNSVFLPVQSLLLGQPLLSDPSTISIATHAKHLLNMPKLADEDLPRRALVSLLLRDKRIHNSACGLDWQTSLLWSLIIDAHTASTATGAPLTSVVQQYSTFLDEITSGKISSRVEEKPLMDGKTLGALLGLSPGPLLVPLQNALMTWQLSQMPPQDKATLDQCDADTLEQYREQARIWIRERWEQGWIVTRKEREVAKKPKAGKKAKLGS